MTAKLALFREVGGDEYVVIVTSGASERHREPGYSIVAEVSIPDTVALSAFPTDRVLEVQ